MEKCFDSGISVKFLIYGSISLIFGTILIIASILVKTQMTNKNEISVSSIMSFVLLLIGGLSLGIGGVFVVNYYYFRD